MRTLAPAGTATERAEEAARARAAHPAAEAPRAAADADLDAVRLDAAARTDLAPEDELAAAPAGLGDRQRERKRSELRTAGDVEEAALEAARLRLVLDEVVDQHVDAGGLVRAEPRLAEQLGLPLLGDAVGAGLVGVLGQPDPLRAEGAPDLGDQLLERRHRDRLAVAAAARERRLTAAGGIGMVRVRVEASTGAAHAADPLDRRDAAAGAARRGHAARDLRPRDHGVDRRVAGVEDLADVDARRGRAQPARLVRLVPHQPLRHPAVARGGGPGEAGERGRARGEVLRPAAVRPPGRPDDPDHGRDPAAAETVEDRVAVLPGVLAARRLDLVPVQVEAHDVDTELLEPVEALVERAAAVGEPGVVLDPEAHVRRGVSRGCAEPEQRAGTDGGEREAHSGRVPGGTRFDTSGSC